MIGMMRRYHDAEEVVIASRSIAALGEELAVGLNTSTDEELQVEISGTFTGTLQLQTTVDGGSNYKVHDPVIPEGGGAAVVNMTAPGTWILRQPKGSAAKVKATAWTSGTAVVTISGIRRT